MFILALSWWPGNIPAYERFTWSALPYEHGRKHNDQWCDRRIHVMEAA